MSDDRKGRFVWPPGSLEEPVVTSSAPPAPRLGLMDLVEVQFLGRVGVSFEKRVRLIGWAPDPLDSFCHRCGGSVGPYEADGDGCAACRTKRLPWSQAYRLGPYAGPIREAVLNLKFHAWRRTGVDLGRHLGMRLVECLDRAQIKPAEAAIVPVPMHWSRRLKAGVDHTLTLSRSCSRVSGVRVMRVLGRKPGPSQLEVSASQRQRNVSRVFFVRKRAKLPRLTVVLDDVRTTGATLRSACRTIRSGCGVEDLWVLTAGVTRARGQRGREAAPEGVLWSIPVIGEKNLHESC